jgi:hypothetical protein
MAEIVIGVILFLVLFGMIGLGYFSIYRLTESTHDYSHKSFVSVSEMETSFAEVHQIISGLDKRFRDLETKLSFMTNDSSRLTEWLDKRDLELIKIQDEFLKSQKLTERETKIIELGENLKLITKKK